MINYPLDSSVQLPESQIQAIYQAVDIADLMAAQAIDAAQNAISFGDKDMPQVLQLAAANMQAAAAVYAAHRKADAIGNAAASIVLAIREMTPEISGAVSDSGTDIGAGIALALTQALKTLSDDNTHNG